MAITVKFYGLGLLSVVDTPTDLEAVTLRLALLGTGYTPNRDTDEFWDDVSTNEIASGTGYNTEGEALTGVAWSYDATSDQVRLDCADVSWTFTDANSWRYGVVYIDTGTASTSSLIALLDWGSQQTVSTAFSLVIDSAGLLYLDCT